MSQQLPLASRPRLGPKPRLGYSASAIDRAAPMRADALLTLIHQPDARAYVTAGEMIVLNKGAEFHDPLFSVANAQEIGEGETSAHRSRDRRNIRQRQAWRAQAMGARAWCRSPDW